MYDMIVKLPKCLLFILVGIVYSCIAMCNIDPRCMIFNRNRIIKLLKSKFSYMYMQMNLKFLVSNKMSGMVEIIRLWAVGPFKEVECSDSISLVKYLTQ